VSSADHAPPDVVLRRSTRVVARTLDGETVIYTDSSQQVFALDAVATVVWELLAAAHPLSQLCERLATLFEADVATVARDLQAPLSTLIAADIVEAHVLEEAAGQ
jgi:hypothetical protein